MAARKHGHLHHGAKPERATPLAATRHDRCIAPPSRQRGASSPPGHCRIIAPLSLAMERGAVRRGESPSSRKGGTVAPSSGASPPVSAGGGHGLMRPEEVTHVTYRQGDQVLRFFP